MQRRHAQMEGPSPPPVEPATDRLPHSEAWPALKSLTENPRLRVILVSLSAVVIVLASFTVYLRLRPWSAPEFESMPKQIMVGADITMGFDRG